MRKKEFKQMVNDYQAPRVEVTEVAVETGYAGSIDVVMPESEIDIPELEWEI